MIDVKGTVADVVATMRKFKMGCVLVSSDGKLAGILTERDLLNKAAKEAEPMKVAIETGTAQGWRVPHRAVVIDADGKANVFQIVGGKAKAVPVTIAVARSDDDLVTGAIDPHARLIVDGAYQVGDGDAVRVGADRHAAASRGTGSAARRHPDLEPGSIMPQARPQEVLALRLPPDGHRLKAGVAEE